MYCVLQHKVGHNSSQIGNMFDDMWPVGSDLTLNTKGPPCLPCAGTGEGYPSGTVHLRVWSTFLNVLFPSLCGVFQHHLSPRPLATTTRTRTWWGLSGLAAYRALSGQQTD